MSPPAVGPIVNGATIFDATADTWVGPRRCPVPASAAAAQANARTATQSVINHRGTRDVVGKANASG